MKREGLAASSSAQASQPSRPANPFSFSQRVRMRPMSRPSTPLTLTRPSASPAVAACSDDATDEGSVFVVPVIDATMEGPRHVALAV